MIISFSLLDIDLIAQEVDPALHLVPIDPPPPCPALLQGGEDTPTLPRALALGVARGHAPRRLRDDLTGTRAGGCKGNRLNINFASATSNKLRL